MRARAGMPPGLLVSIAAPALAAAALAAALVEPGSTREPALPDAGAEPVLGRVALVEARAREPAGSAGRGRRPGRPQWVAIPGLGVDGPVDPVGARHGRLEIPPPGRAGWFAAGPRPGEPGRAVIVSHVDSRQGPELFAGLRTLGRGARILVRDRDGGLHRFRVMRRRQVDKSRFAAESVYGGSAVRELVLITCGGPFRPGKGYRDNVILHARAAGPLRLARERDRQRGRRHARRAMPARVAASGTRERRPATP